MFDVGMYLWKPSRPSLNFSISVVKASLSEKKKKKNAVDETRAIAEHITDKWNMTYSKIFFYFPQISREDHNNDAKCTSICSWIIDLVRFVQVKLQKQPTYIWNQKRTNI